MDPLSGSVFTRMAGSLRKRRRKDLIGKGVHWLMVFALLAGMIPWAPARAQAPTQTPVSACSAPTSTPPASSLFVPFLSTISEARSRWSPSPAQVDRELKYEVGKTYQYAYKLTIDTESRGQNSDGILTGTSSQSIVSAIADVTITGQGEDGAYSGELTIRSPYLCSSTQDGDATEVENEELTADLLRPLRFVQSRTGEITGVQIPQDLSPTAANIQKGILNALQMQLRAESSYNLTETGVQGEYQARYSTAESNGNLNVVKQINQDDFNNMVSAGDENEGLELLNRIEATLDGTQGVYSRVEISETIRTTSATAEQAAVAQDEFDGVGAWSVIQSVSVLELEQVVATQARAAHAPDAIYVATDFGAELDDSFVFDVAFDITEIDLDAELDALEAEPETPEVLDYVLTLALADHTGALLTKIGQRLQGGKSDEVVAAYVAVLSAIGTPAAQDVLINLLPTVGDNAQISATTSITTQEQVMIGILLLNSPSITTSVKLESLADAEAYDLREEALMSLGGVAGALGGSDRSAEEQARSQEIAQKMVQDLQQIEVAGLLDDEVNEETEDFLELYLSSLGNVGSPASLDTIQDFTGVNSLVVQIAAYDAMRKIPGNQVESLLLGVLSDDEADDELRDLVASVLMSRDDLSNQARESLGNFEEAAEALAPGGLYRNSWNRILGRSDFGVELPGGYTVASPPNYYPLYLYAYQRAIARAWSFRYTLAQAELVSRRISGNRQLFGAYLSVAGNRFNRKIERTLPDRSTASGTLFNQSVQFFNYSQRIPIYGPLSVTIQARASGHIRLTYNYGHDLRNVAQPTMSGTITPRVWATATASASVSIEVLRGGATLSATLLNTSIPTSATLSYSQANNRFTFCLNVRAISQPLSAQLAIWADRRSVSVSWRGIRISWSRIVTRNLWTYTAPTRTYDLVVRCY